MIKNLPHNLRLLAISPSSYGFGFAVLERPGELVDWGVKSAEGDKNLQSLLKIKELISRYTPDVLVLQDCGEHSRRSERI